ncbi:MAG TPA: transglycosylase family protein [Candidatus Limnocylindrales bacterium]|nr:transglycosylase family protein [Candidatus Limnocylindrales bacterium]
MPVRRARAAFVAVLATVLVLGLVPPSPAVAHDPEGIDRFMYAVGQVESGGRYKARNPVSGAYGKYQIMPSNWRAWAKLYLGNAYAAPSPKNQEIVARAKMHGLHRWLGSWRRVAYWWLTGSSKKNEATWSAYAKRYVSKVMKIYRAEPAITGNRRAYQETDSAIVYTGAWQEAPFPKYAGQNARWTNETGATATFTFTGRAVLWRGPSGPTRGRAFVFVDGVYARTVDLYALHFQPRTRIFYTTFAQAGPHTLRIEVVPTKGRHTVAIDQFVVTD